MLPEDPQDESSEISAIFEEGITVDDEHVCKRLGCGLSGDIYSASPINADHFTKDRIDPDPQATPSRGIAASASQSA